MSAGDLPQPAAAAPGPVVRVVRGHPTPEELAALVTVLAARSGSGSQPVPGPTSASRWADPRRVLRGPVPPPLGSWRTSALPG